MSLSSNGWKLQKAVDQTVIDQNKLIRLHKGDYSHLQKTIPPSQDTDTAMKNISAYLNEIDTKVKRMATLLDKYNG